MVPSNNPTSVKEDCRACTAFDDPPRPFCRPRAARPWAKSPAFGRRDVVRRLELSQRRLRGRRELAVNLARARSPG